MRSHFAAVSTFIQKLKRLQTLIIPYITDKVPFLESEAIIFLITFAPTKRD